MLPTITDAEASAMAKSLLSDDSRVILATMPQKAGAKVPTEAELQAAITTATNTRVAPWADSGATRALMEHAPAASDCLPPDDHGARSEGWLARVRLP